MRRWGIALALSLLAAPVQADEVFGVWETEKAEDGRYLHVRVHACEVAPAQVCGTIVGAFDGADPTVVGKAIIWDMVADGTGAWNDGKIWKADDDEIYDSEMALEGDVLVVSGCVLGGLICRSQRWPRVE